MFAGERVMTQRATYPSSPSVSVHTWGQASEDLPGFPWFVSCPPVAPAPAGTAS